MSRTRGGRLLLFACLLAAGAVAASVPSGAAGSPSAHPAKKKRAGPRSCAANRSRAAKRRCVAKRKVFRRCGRPRHRRGWSRRDLDGDRIPNRRDRNVDGDRKRNTMDCDIDGDAALNCKPGRTRDNSRDKDTDGDGIPNRRDPDIDCDGIPNYEDDDSDASGLSLGGSIPDVHLPRSFFGVVADQVSFSSGAARQAVLDQIRGTGAGLLRQKFEWARIETAPGFYDFSYYDRYLADVVRRGFTVLPVLFEPPPWRALGPSDGHDHYPPRSGAEFAAFASRLVGRYGPHGSFWNAHPGLPYRPLRAWQVWNEPHIRAYWPTGPNPYEYVALARPVATAIHAADPGAQVIAAALSESNIGVPMDGYLEGMYAAGAASVFDALAVHPYAGAADQTFDIMDRVRRIADANGDGSAGLWMTELGWATGGPASPYNLGEHAQAELVKRVWAALVTEKDRLKLKGMIYFNWRDQPPYAPLFQDFFGLHTGLLAIDGRHKPAYDSFAHTVQAME